jgi:hypothetical protein
MHERQIKNGGTLRLADLAGFEAIELHPTIDGRRVHVAAYTAAELAAKGFRVVTPEDHEPAEPTAEDYAAGFAARERWERERHGITPGGADRGALQAAADALTAASDRARAALDAVTDARAKVEDLAGGADAPAPRITAGGNIVSGEED